MPYGIIGLERVKESQVEGPRVAKTSEAGNTQRCTYIVPSRIRIIDDREIISCIACYRAVLFFYLVVSRDGEMRTWIIKAVFCAA